MITGNNINILYEDNHLLVVDKPANVPVQPDSSGDPDLLTILKDYLKHKYEKHGNVFLGLVHRLDRPTPGLMVFAKTSKAASRLSDQIRRRVIEKTYLAVVEGKTRPSGHLIHHLEKDREINRVRVVQKRNKRSKTAELTYQTLETINDHSLVRIELITGRSHQIRIQFTEEGHPIYGDWKYNPHKHEEKQLALYASELAFEHPTLKKMLRFKQDPPECEPWSFFGYLRENKH